MARAILLFSTGFIAGAHKYHLEYYCPAFLNPRVTDYPDGYATCDERVLISSKNALYYKNLEEKMEAY